MNPLLTPADYAAKIWGLELEAALLRAALTQLHAELDCGCNAGSMIYGCNRCRLRKTLIEPVLYPEETYPPFTVEGVE